MKEQLIFPRKGFINPHHEGIVPLAIRLSVDIINDAGRIRCRKTRQDLLRKRINVDNYIPGDRLPGQHRRARQVAAGGARNLVFARGIEQLSRIKIKVCWPTCAAKIDRLPCEEGTEIPRLFIRCRDDRGPGLALSQSQSFIASKDEGLIFPNRATRGKAELVPDKLRPGRARNFFSGRRINVVEGKEIACVQLLVS